MSMVGSRGRGAVVVLCFFFSGLSALVYEVLWVRQFELVFGAAAYSMGAVLAAYMGGLGLGSWAGGRLADRIRRPLAAYGLLEVAIGLYALLFPFLYGAAHGAYLGLEMGRDLPAALSLAVRFLAAILLLLPPTALMGATLPLLAKAVTGDPTGVGKSVGGLYGVNLVGAVVGTLLAGFSWIPSFGLSKTLLLAAVLNLVLGAVAFWMGKGPGMDPASGPGPVPIGEGAVPSFRRWALWVVALSGLSAMAYQTGFTRLLVMTLGGSVHAFSAMLSSFLAGLGLGALLISRGRWLREEGLVFRLSGTLVGTGLCALGTGFLVDRLPYFFLWLHTEVSRLGIVGVGSHRLVQFLVSGSLLLPTAVGLGAIFPMALQMGRPSQGEVGNWTGRLYAWNTFGAILGSVSTAFFLLPLLGIQGSLAVGVLLHWGAAALLFWSVASARKARWWAPGIWSVGFLIVLLLPRWNSHRLAMGPYDNLRYVKVERLKDLQHPSEVRRMLVDRRVGSMELLHYREGVSSTVSVERNAYPQFLILFNNGKPEASTQTDLGTQQLIAHLPLLWFEASRGRPAKEVGMVGLASGISAGAALRHGLERLTVAEIEPSMPEAARLFKDFNFDALSDPRFRFLADDGRHHLETRPGVFDVVISEPSNPWISGVANLFTKEAFGTGRRALGPGGVFCQWVQAYNMDISGLRTIVRTFRSVFPQAFLFGVPPSPGGTEPGPDLILVGSVEPLEISIKELERLMGEEKLKAALQRIGIRRVEDLVGLLRMGPTEMDRFTGEGPLNTDDNCLIEYSAPNWFYRDTHLENLAEVARFRTDPGKWLKLDGRSRVKGR